MADNGMISAEELLNVVNDRFVASDQFDWHGVVVKVTTLLPLERMMLFVEHVVDMCISGTTNELMPEILCFAIDDSLILFYTNIEMPEELNERFKIVYGTDLVSRIRELINEEQFNDIVDGIHERIKYIAQSRASVIEKRFGDIYTELNKIEDKFESVMSGIEDDDLRKMVKNLSNITEDDIIRSIITEQKNEN